MTPSDLTPTPRSPLKPEGKLLEAGSVGLAVLGTVYLLGVSYLRFLGHAICSSGGCTDVGPYGGGWENISIAVLVVLAFAGLRVVAHSRGRWSGAYVAVSWFAVLAVLLFAAPFFV